MGLERKGEWETDEFTAELFIVFWVKFVIVTVNSICALKLKYNDNASILDFKTLLIYLANTCFSYLQKYECKEWSYSAL